MHVLVMGAGALGAYYGGLLSLAGHDVTFIARGAHLAALQAQGGVRVESYKGDFAAKARALQDPATAGPADLVLLCVKTYDTEPAAEALRPVLAQGGLVLTLQNGVDSVSQLQAILGDCVLGGSAYIESDVPEPGLVKHTARGEVTFGDPKNQGRALPIVRAFEAAGIPTTHTEQVDYTLWNKFVMLASFSAITTATRLPIGPIRECPQTMLLYRQLVAEACGSGYARGVELPGNTVERVLDATNSWHPGFKSSMLRDLEKGRRLEVDSLSGTVARLGREAGSPAPGHAAIHALLKPYAMGLESLDCH